MTNIEHLLGHLERYVELCHGVDLDRSRPDWHHGMNHESDHLLDVWRGLLELLALPIVDPKTGRVDLRYNPFSVEVDISIPRGLDTDEEYRERVDRILKKNHPLEYEKRLKKRKELPDCPFCGAKADPRWYYKGVMFCDGCCPDKKTRPWILERIDHCLKVRERNQNE